MVYTDLRRTGQCHLLLLFLYVSPFQLLVADSIECVPYEIRNGPLPIVAKAELPYTFFLERFRTNEV